MKRELDDKTVAQAALKRLEEEIIELIDAVILGDRAIIVDELADVGFYVERVRSACGLSSELVGKYGKVKSTLRDAGFRNKSVELRLAAEFVIEA